MACWPDGICCSASFRLHMSIDRELSMLMRMAFLANVASACSRIVRYHRRRRTLGTPDCHQHCWTNLLPLRLWVIRWMLICCPNCPDKTYIGPVSVSMFDHIWLAVRSVWPVNLLDLGGLRWVTYRSATVGIVWPWTFLICQ